MKKIGDSKKNLNSNQPTPDNRGIEFEETKDVDEAAAEANRDIGALLKIYPKQKPNKSKESNPLGNK